MAWEKAKATRALLRALTSKGDSPIEISIVLVMATGASFDSVGNSTVQNYLQRINRCNGVNELGRLFDEFYLQHIKPIISVKSSLPGFPTCQVLMSRKIPKEIRKIISYSEPEKQRNVAQEMLVALAEIEEILQKGDKNGWYVNHHEMAARNQEALFCYARKTIFSSTMGKRVKAIVTIRYQAKEHYAYALNVGGSATYKTKIEHLESEVSKADNKIIFSAKNSNKY